VVVPARNDRSCDRSSSSNNNTISITTFESFSLLFIPVASFGFASLPQQSVKSILLAIGSPVSAK
jgi:hypothetical protein